jgi:hypothetical protein
MTDMSSLIYETAAEIIAEKIAAGIDAYLWVHDSGDVILRCTARQRRGR